MVKTIVSLEQSLQKCSIIITSNPMQDHPKGVDTDVNGEVEEMNSDGSLPHQWEQCLDLKTGEIYYINLRNGAKTKDDPRKVGARFEGGNVHAEEDSSEESEGFSSSVSSPSSSPSTSTEDFCYEDHILVVTGCRSCYMYLMLPKMVEECPKCNSTLVRFD